MNQSLEKYNLHSTSSDVGDDQEQELEITYASDILIPTITSDVQKE